MNAGAVALMIPIVTVLVIGMIIVAAILMKGQQRIAEMHSKREDDSDAARIAALEAQVGDLRERLNDAILASESGAPINREFQGEETGSRLQSRVG